MSKITRGFEANRAYQDRLQDIKDYKAFIRYEMEDDIGFSGGLEADEDNDDIGAYWDKGTLRIPKY